MQLLRLLFLSGSLIMFKISFIHWQRDLCFHSSTLFFMFLGRDCKNAENPRVWKLLKHVLAIAASQRLEGFVRAVKGSPTQMFTFTQVYNISSALLFLIYKCCAVNLPDLLSTCIYITLQPAFQDKLFPFSQWKKKITFWFKHLVLPARRCKIAAEFD